MKQSFFSHALAAALLAATFGPMVPALGGHVPAVLREREEKIQKIAREAAPAVVALMPDTDENKKSARRAFGTGSGVIVSADGLVLTAAHVLDAVGDEFLVILSDGTRAKAKAKGKNFSRDAALAQITTPGKYPYVDRADPSALGEGEWCLAFGHPGGYEVNRAAPIRLGRILDKDADGFLVTDCTLSGGDSGGPLFNLEGKLIGIHSSIGWRLAENRHVPMASFMDSWDRLMKGESWGTLGVRERRGPRGRVQPAPAEAPDPDQPLLGVVVQPGEEEGALVAQVSPDSPAHKAGVKAGDVIDKVNDEAISDEEALVKAIRKMKPGDKITLTITRDGEEKKLEATLIAARNLKDE
jgi:serine protease Do